MNVRSRWLPRWLSAGALLMVVAACGADRNDTLGSGAAGGVAPTVEGVTVAAQTVNVIEKEWNVSPDLGTVPTGPVTFIAKNVGDLTHEMLVIRTDLPDGQIPIGADHKLNEDSDQSRNVGEISEYNSGTTGTVTLTLKPGTYQLVCNIAGHYAKGMHAQFTVAPGAVAAPPVAVQSAGNQTINVVEKEWNVSPDGHTVPAGPVTFIAKNVGDLTHEMLIIRTDLPDGQIPTGADHKLNEASDQSRNVGEISEYNSGSTGTVTLTLPAGKYQLVCNIAGHYAKGMHAEVTVT